jgi:hypothetical protein
MISFPHCCGLKEPDKYVLNHFRIEVRIISVLETVAVRSNLFRQRRNMASNTTGDNVTNVETSIFELMLHDALNKKLRRKVEA